MKRPSTNWTQTGTCTCCGGAAWVLEGAILAQGGRHRVRCDFCRQYCVAAAGLGSKGTCHRPVIKKGP
jgi:hypothetical protein